MTVGAALDAADMLEAADVLELEPEGPVFTDGLFVVCFAVSSGDSVAAAQQRKPVE